MSSPSSYPLVQLDPRETHHHLSRGRTVLTTARDGTIGPNGEEGLWVYQTRVLSKYAWEIAGKPPTFSALSALEQHRDLVYYIFPPPECKKGQEPGCDPAQNAVELRLERQVGEGLAEEVTLTNHTQITTTFPLGLKVAADFASPSEAGTRRKQMGRLTQRWQRLQTGGCTLSFDYQARHRYNHQGKSGIAAFHRGIRLLVRNDHQPANYRYGRIVFHVTLAPRETWHASLLWTAQLDGADLPSPDDFAARAESDRRAFLDASTAYRASECPAAKDSAAQSGSLAPLVNRTIRQSIDDLAALRLYDLAGDRSVDASWVPAAGIPVYVALFARDILFTSRAAASLNPAIMRGSLAVLAEHLGTQVDDWRDEQPGRIVHALQFDPLAMLNYAPHARYFGSVSGSFFYPSVLADLWRWTGSKQIVAPLLEPALRGLAWADRYSRDESGFYKYRTRSTQGEKNQGWKDSGDAIVYPDGSQVKDPLGTCEMQSYVYASKRELSDLLWTMGDQDTARRLKREADELKQRFNDFFWMEEEGYIAFGIDSHDRQIRSIASDPGHCLMHGILDESRREAVSRRLLAGDMFSGWGVRTLSSDHPAFNPFSYHCGSVWPADNSAIVHGLARSGMHAEMNRLAGALFEAAALFKFYRLPEVFAGHSRDEEHPFPGLYPKANSPQAWSASAPLLVLQSMLGIHPYAPAQTLLVDPHLPDWLPELTLVRLRVGEATASIRFRRQPSGDTTFEVLEVSGELRVVQHLDPWSLTTGPTEEVREKLSQVASAASAANSDHNDIPANNS